MANLVACFEAMLFSDQEQLWCSLQHGHESHSEVEHNQGIPILRSIYLTNDWNEMSLVIRYKGDDAKPWD